MLSSTLVILTADHGERFGTDGYYSRPRQLYGDLLHVPLAVRGPDVGVGAYDGPVSTLDIVPTVLESAGVQRTSRLPGIVVPVDVTGDSADDRVVFSQTRAERDGAQAVRYSGRSSDSMAYVEWDTETEQLTVTENTDSEQLLDAVRKHAANRNEFVPSSEKLGEDLSSDVKERLEVLGYRE